MDTPDNTRITFNTYNQAGGDDFQQDEGAVATRVITTLVDGPIYKEIQLTTGGGRDETFNIYALQNWFISNFTQVIPNGESLGGNAGDYYIAGGLTGSAYYSDGVVRAAGEFQITDYGWVSLAAGPDPHGVGFAITGTPDQHETTKTSCQKTSGSCDQRQEQSGNKTTQWSVFRRTNKRYHGI